MRQRAATVIDVPRPKGPEKVTMSFRLDPAVADRLKELRWEKRKTVTELVEGYILAGLAAEDAERKQPTKGRRRG